MELEEWINETERILRQQGLTGTGAVDQILLHLEGPAREEVRGQEILDPQALFKILREAFGENLDVGEIVALFHSRCQKSGKSLREYFYALKALVERAQKLKPLVFGDKETADLVLRDRFKDGIVGEVRGWLCQRVRDNPNKSFGETLKESILYEEDLGKGGKKVVKGKQEARQVGGIDGLDSQKVLELLQGQQTLIQMLQEQQKQQKQVIEQMQKVANAGPPSGATGMINKAEGNSYQSKERGPCFFCKKRGHIKKECLAFKRSLSGPSGRYGVVNPAPWAGGSFSPVVQQGKQGVVDPAQWAGGSSSQGMVNPAHWAGGSSPRYPFSVYPPSHPGVYNTGQSEQGTCMPSQPNVDPLARGSGSCSINVDSDTLPSEELIRKTVGTRPFELITINGVPGQALVDSGSQVSAVSETFFKRELAPAGVELLDIDWLEASAVNGLSIPYLGLIIADVTVGNNTIKDKGILVSKDTLESEPSKDKVPGLLGMNILRELPKYSRFAPVDQNFDQKAGYVKVAGVNGVVLPPYSISEIQVKTSCRSGVAFVEPLADMVCGVARVAAGLIEVPTGQAKVEIANFSEGCVKIPAKTKLGIVSNVEIIQESAIVQGMESRSASLEVREPVNSDVLFEMDENLQEIDLSGVSDDPELCKQVKQLLFKHRKIFDTSNLGCTETLKHKIMTVDDFPVAQPYRRIPPQLWREVKDHIQELLRKQVIQESKSSYAAPIVIVRKKSGAIRMCCDYRQLNAKISRDVYPIPRIEESLDTMSGSKIFSTIDLASAYHQVEVEPEDRPKTAFTTPFGLYEWTRMPFGLSNAPATFQRLMSTIFRDDVLERLIVYLDDIVVFSGDTRTHLDRLDTVFSKLARHGLRVEPKKCTFFQQSVRFLGHVVSSGGVATDPAKVAAVAGWVRPETVKELRRFLGFCSYYRRFVKGYASLSAPLHKLVGEVASKDKGKCAAIGKFWEETHENAFNKLKLALTSTPVLGYADFSLPFILETDASSSGLEAVLSQRQEGVVRVIAYASRGLRKSERNQSNYSSKKLELLALKWAIVDKYRDYLQGSTFKVYTDNNPMTYLLTKSKLPATEQKWASALAGFDFTIHYRPGKSNINADALSRQEHRSWDATEICSMVTNTVNLPGEVRCKSLESSLQEKMVAAEVSRQEVQQVEGATGFPMFSTDKIKRLQRGDLNIGQLYKYWCIGVKPDLSTRRHESRCVQLLLKQWCRLEVRDNLFYRKVNDPHHGMVTQLLVPTVLKPEILKMLHDEHGHQGVERTISLIRSRFYWPECEKEVRQYIGRCNRCLLTKKEVVKTPLGTLTASRPMEIVAIDFTILEKSSSGIQTSFRQG